MKRQRLPNPIGTLKGAKFNGQTFTAWVTNKLEWEVSAEAPSGAVALLLNIRPVGMDRTGLQKGCGMLYEAGQRLGGRISYGFPSRNRPSTDGFRPCGGVNPKVIPWPKVIPHPKRLPSAVLAWNDGTVVKLAQGIEQRRQTADLPILADALEEAGWDYAIILRQLRTKPDTARWVLDWILRPGEMEEETFHRNILGCWTIADFIQRGGAGWFKRR